MDEQNSWKKEYTLVLILNILYVIAFYYIMISNA